MPRDELLSERFGRTAARDGHLRLERDLRDPCDRCFERARIGRRLPANVPNALGNDAEANEHRHLRPDHANEELVVSRLVEGFGVASPSIVDACAFVHGPLQSIYEREASIVVLARTHARARDPENPSSALVERLRACVDPSRHGIVVIDSDLPGPLAALEHDAKLLVAVRDGLEASTWDLVDWPGKGKDGALYDLGASALESNHDLVRPTTP